MLDYLVLSIKNLKHRGLRSWLTLLGIFIGIAAVVSLISLGNGLKIAVSSQFGISSTEVLSVEAGGVSLGPPGSGVSDPLTIKELDAIKKLGSVKRAVRRNLVSGKVEYNDKIIFSIITNLPNGEDRDFVYEQIEVEIIDGRKLKEDDSKKVLLGYNFYANKMGFDKQIISGKKIIIQDKKYEVIGIVDKKGSFMFDNAIYMNENDLEEIGNYGDEIDIIAVLPKYKEEIEKTKEEIEKTLRKVRDVKVGEEDFKVSTPEAMMNQVNSVLGGIQIFIAIVASISILIGAIGIINTMTTSVLERRKDIGIMKSVGATNQQIFLQFFFESSLLGLVGGTVGVLLGTLVGVLGTLGINSYVGSDVTPSINFILIISSLFGSFLIGGISGIVPAMNAAKQNPVDALRN